MSTVYRSNINAYHINERHQCDYFLRHDCLIHSSDDEFLGEGMYFWETEEGALYWLNERRRKDPKLIFSKVKCRLDTEECFDLTDLLILKEFLDTWRKMSTRANDNPNAPLGHIINKMSNFLEDPPKVVRAILRYKNTRNLFSKMAWSKKGVYFTSDNRIIYNVLDKEMILHKERRDIS